MSAAPNIIAISIGNSRTRAGLFEEGKLGESTVVPNNRLAELVQRVIKWWQQIEKSPGPAVVLASVNDQAAAKLRSLVQDQLALEVYTIGDDLPVPIGLSLDPETITGADRLLNAAAAYDSLQQACVIIDAGTAVTVDFVDGEGTFHGGAIAPGARLQLQSLHEHTAALPELDFVTPQAEPFGRSTSQAMLQGVYHGIRGMAGRLIERYAEAFGAYPMVIATGGDAELLFEDDQLVDRVVADLTLLGIAVAARRALATNPDDD